MIKGDNSIMSNEFDNIRMGVDDKITEFKKSNSYGLFIDKLINIIGEEKIKFNEPMSNHTSFKVGGPADILVAPYGISDLISIVELCRSEQVPFLVIGNGTNLIVRDKGIRGVVIKTAEHFKNYSVNGDIIEAESGILLSDLSKIALENGLTGLEFACGIPGTLGGAVVMNAGAYGGEMKNIVIKTCYLNTAGELKHVEGDNHLFGYRTSFIQKEGGIVLKTYMKLDKGNKDNIKNQMDDLDKKRSNTQPLEMPSAGSVFKRPEGHYTGPLIEQCGLKGYSMGGAQVSNKHCGFIVNKGDATASDILAVIKYVQERVKAQFGVQLEPEIKIIGEE